MVSEKSIKKFNSDIALTLQINEISFNEFRDDYRKASERPDVFERKYSQLFDGTIRNYKDFNSFSGSYRRNVNPKYFSDDKQLKLQQLKYREISIKRNRETVLVNLNKARQEVYNENIVKRITYYKKNRKTIKKHLDGNEMSLIYEFPEWIESLKEAWNLKKLSEFQFKYQIVQIDVEFHVETKGVVIFDYQHNSVSSGITYSQDLISLYFEAYDKVLFLLETLRNRYQVEIDSLSCIVYRIGENN